MRETGRVLGWATLPVWWPIREMGRDTLRLKHSLWLIPRGQVLGWKTKLQTDVRQFEGWTPEERARVLRQEIVWFGLLLASVLMSLTARNWLPILVMSLTWWARAHDAHIGGKLLPHFDLVRWALGYPQVIETQPTILDRFKKTACDEDSNEPL